MERKFMLNENGKLTEIPFRLLEVGDKFQIFEDGIQYIDSYGQIEWTVAENPVEGVLKVVETTE